MSLFVSCNKTDRPLDKKEHNLRINLKKEPVSLDPRRGNDMAASQLHFMLFEGLVRLNADMTLSPAQASSYEISPDGKTYTFFLGEAKWSDGTAVTAFDFEKSWKSILNPKFPSPDAYLLYSVKNAKLAKEGKVPLSTVGISSKDFKTLIVELEAPAHHFLQIVASSVLLPIHSAMEEIDPNWAASPTHFISNGPFKLKEWRFNQEMILEKNHHFRAAKDVKLDHVFIDIIDRELAALHMYASGHFDVLGAPLSFFPEMLHQDLEKKQLLTYFPVANTKFLAFNTAAFPFHNANIRRAFGLAIHRKEMVKHITQLNEQAALTLIPPVLISNNEQPMVKDGDEVRAREYLQKGLQELKLQAADLKEIVFMYCISEVNYLLAQELQNRWLEVLGVKVKLQGVEFKMLHERSRKSDFSIGIFAWMADYGDPMNILERFQDKTNHRNYPKWENAAYNQLIHDALTAPTRQIYLQKVHDAEQILIEEMPIAGLYHENYVFLIQPHVQGFEVSPLGHIYFEKISLKD